MTREWDLVIVGGGAAGCVMASRLSEATDRSVLLLEAGPDLRAEMPDDVRDGRRPTFDHDWGYSSEPDPQGSIRALYRGKLLGGCSSTNATFALRGHPADYDGWAAAGNTGWSFADVLPYFCKLETDEDFGWTEWHGSSGPLPIRRYGDHELTDVALAGLEALQECGFPRIPDANEPGAVGLARLPVNACAGERISTALGYLPPADSRSNLTIRCNAQVAALILDDARTVGVRLLSGEVIRASEVVISAGAYASPALLMRSGIGQAAALRSLDIPVVADLPGVGQNLIDHPAVSIDLLYDRAVEPVPVFQVAATFHSSAADSGGPPDLQCMVGGPYEGEAAMFFLGAALLKPRSRGSLTLRSIDPVAPPRIDLGYFRASGDLDRLLEGLERVREAAQVGAIKELSGGHQFAPGSEADLRSWVQRKTWTYHHPVGTCAMGVDPSAGAVVDPMCRVHGISGLRVVDASIMPDIPSANTHLPTIMIAERAAALIDGQA
ncbi:MAG: GMC family oxidoreductase [Propionibacteriaceae bacterium]|jgi:choline dehydrogenase